MLGKSPAVALFSCKNGKKYLENRGFYGKIFAEVFTF